MSIRRLPTLFLLLLSIQSCVVLSPLTNQPRKNSAFKQVDFQDLINRYMKREENNSIEGVYSVSAIVTKKAKNLLGVLKDKTTDRRENYAKVAILKEKSNGRDYIELSLNKKDLASYSIVGEFNIAANGDILVYKHFEPKAKETSYTFTLSENSEILEGVRVENDRNAQITYKLIYVKLTPK